MKRLVLLVATITFTLSGWAVTNTATVNEIEHAAQTNEPITFGRMFADGEIATCPKVQVGGVDPTVWQADVKNHWPDGSVRFAIISYQANLTSLGTNALTFVNVAGTTGCSSGGSGLTQAQAATIMCTNHPTIVATPGAPGAGTSAVTTDACTILNADDPRSETFGNCKNNVWLDGPVVTAFILQDCTSAFTYDFGWKWDGTNMATDAGTTHNAASNITSSTYASNHPMFIAYCYPSFGAGNTSNGCKMEMVLEVSPWTGKYQDQLLDVAFKIGTTTKYQQTGARRFTDARASASNWNVTSAAQANFQTSDVGSVFVACTTALGAQANGCADGTSPVQGYAWDVIVSRASSTSIGLQTYGGNAGYIPCFTINCVGLDQLAYINLRGGGTRILRTFWTGTQPGRVRIDHNWDYMVSTKVFPAYDTTSIAKSSADAADDANEGVTNFATWALFPDKGIPTGFGQFNALDFDEASNSESAPMQREWLNYFTQMGSNAGTPGGLSAKAMFMLNGEYSDYDATQGGWSSSCLIAGVATNCNAMGGVGMIYQLGNFPYHLRESRPAAQTPGAGGNVTSGNPFYVATLADPNARGGDTATQSDAAPNNATGKPYSVYTWSNESQVHGGLPFSQLIPVATYSLAPAGWMDGSGCDHIQFWEFEDYATSGSYYELENLYMNASYCHGNISPDPSAVTGNRYFRYVNGNFGGEIRKTSVAIQADYEAAVAAPDVGGITCLDGTTGSPEKCLYMSYLFSTAEILKGILNNTDNSDGLLPTHYGTGGCTSQTYGNTNNAFYNYLTANRYDWGRCTAMSQCITTGTACAVNLTSNFHQTAPGVASVTALAEGNVYDYVNVVTVPTGFNAGGCSTLPQGYAHVSGTGIASIDTIQNSSGCSIDPDCVIMGSGSGATCTFNHLTQTYTVTNAGSGYSANLAASWVSQWMPVQIALFLGNAERAGFPALLPIAKDALAYPVELLMSASTVNSTLPLAAMALTFNAWQDISDKKPYDGNVFTTDKAFVDYTTYFATWPTTMTRIQSFGQLGPQIACPGSPPTTYCVPPDPPTDNIPGGAHGWSVVYRAALAMAKTLGVNTSVATCPSGLCKADDAWTFATNEHPYFGQALHSCTLSGSSWNCTGTARSLTATALGFGDDQIRFAFAPQASPATPGSIQTQNTIRKAGTVMQ